MADKKRIFTNALMCLVIMGISISAYGFLGGKFKLLKPENGKLYIPVKDINDYKAHYFKVKAKDGTMVNFFTVKSRDNIIRAAIDACDVCYKSGKGYVQEDNFMVCTNCGRKFATDRINEVKGGCNPAPLKRTMENDKLIISMTDINENSWYCKYKN